MLQVAHSNHAHAQLKEPGWAGRPYQYMIVDQDLRTVLEEFGRNNGVRITLTQAVQGRVRGNMPSGNARTFLDDVTRAYGLNWYFDGVGLFVSASSESQTKLVNLQGRLLEEVLARMKELEVYDERYQLRPGPSPKLATVSGPPRFVEAITIAVGAMEPIVVEAPAKSIIVTVFQGIGGQGERYVFQPAVSK